MAKTIENLFLFLHFSTNVLIILLYLLFLKRIKAEKGLFLIVLYSFSDLLMNVVLLNVSTTLNLYITALFTLLEYLLFTYFIYFAIKKKGFKMLMNLLSILFIIFIVIYDLVTHFRFIDSIPIGFESILILVFSFYYLYEQMNDVNNLFIYSRYQFWIVIGIMLYLAGSFFIFILASHVNKVILDQFWFLTNVFYSIMNILFAIAFFIGGKSKKKTQPPVVRNFRLI